MLAKKFSKKEAINFGWKTALGNGGFFVVLFIIVALINVVPTIILKSLAEDTYFTKGLAGLISYAFSLIISLGLIKIALKFCDKQEPSFGDLFSSLPLLFQYLIGSSLYALIIFSGMILLIVPGIIWSIQFSFYGYFIIDKGLGPIEALKQSSRITRGSKWNLLLFGLLLCVINIAGFLCLIVGLFATLPLAMVASALVYRKLVSQLEAAAAETI